MKNILKSTVALPFKFIKGIFELMKALLNTILKLFGHPGLPTGGSHSAETDKPDSAPSDDVIPSAEGMSKKPSNDFVKRTVNDDVLSVVKSYIASPDRKPSDLSTLSKNMRLYMSGLSASKLNEMSKLSDEGLRYQIFNDMKELKVRQSQTLKHKPETHSSESNEFDETENKKMSKIQQRIKAKRQQSVTSYKTSLAM